MAQKIRDGTVLEEKKEEKKEKKPEKKEEKKKEESKENVTSLVRIMSTDIPGNKKVCYGLIRIKGISYSFASAVCNSLGIPQTKTISSLSEDEIKKITDFINNPQLPVFLLNRRKDFETGSDMHLTGTNLDFRKEFDIKKMKQIRSYKGWRHAIGQPVRGQRTKSHFRHGKSMGVIKTKQKPAAAEGKEKKSKEKGK